MRRVLIAILLLAACSSPPSEGYVLDKRHVPARDHWHDDSHYQCIVYDNKGTCTSQIWIEDGHLHFHPEKWELKLEECKERKGRNCRTGWKNLGSGEGAFRTWDQYNIGMHYPNPR